MKNFLEFIGAFLAFPVAPLLCVVLGECLADVVSNSLPPCIQTPFMEGGER